MFALSRFFLLFGVAGDLLPSPFPSTPARADEMVQNLGPVGPSEALLATIGNLRLIAFFEPGNGRCALNAIIWDNLAVDAGEFS